MGGGDSTARGQEHDSAGFAATLRDAFTQQFGHLQDVMSFLTNKLTGQVNNPTGFSPQAKAAMTTNAMQTTATDYANAKAAAQAASAAHGGSTLPNGVQAQIQGQLAQAGANEQTSQLNNINLADEQLKEENQWRAISGLEGVAGMENPTQYSSAANQTENAIAGLSEANTASQNADMGPVNGLLSGLGQGFGSGFGSGLAKGLGHGQTQN
jgi:hypothetical protein